MKFYFLIGFIFFTFSSVAQEKKNIRFSPTISHQLIELGKNYHFEKNNTQVQIEVLRFYISDIQLIHDDKVVYTFVKKHWLLDLDHPSSLNIEVDVEAPTTFDKIKFNIGVDSLTNVSGAFGGDLDPTNGMYWTWQSGYINFKLEGTSDNCPARQNRFQFHLGGFQAPFTTLQNIELTLNDDEKNTVYLPLDSFFAKNNLSKNYQVMSPNQQAVDLSNLLANLFTIK